MGLISHRLLMPKLLLPENREVCRPIYRQKMTPNILQGWAIMQKLLIALFKFLAPFLKDSELSVPARDMYRGALRILLVLLHDFPDFLSEYHVSLCDSIPPHCLWMFNIILSAYPTDLNPTDAQRSEWELNLEERIRTVYFSTLREQRIRPIAASQPGARRVYSNPRYRRRWRAVISTM